MIWTATYKKGDKFGLQRGEQIGLTKGRAEGRAEGEQIGLHRGEQKISGLVTLLLNSGRIDDLVKLQNKDDLNALYEEFGLI